MRNRYRLSILPAAVSLLALLVVPWSSYGQDWQLVWSDEFEADTIDSSKWEHEVNGFGGGNNELQYYTDREVNSFVQNGHLVIQALKESFTGDDGTRDYTSARLRTRYRGDWVYGRLEVRARMPFGQGLWPAIWMLPTDSEYGVWAASGEIDIVELVGQEPDKILGTIHYGGASPRNRKSGTTWTLPAGTFADDFHLFAVEWEPGEIRWYVDDFLYQTLNSWFSEGGPFPAPFNRRFHLLLNVAVGGDLPGSPNAGTMFPQRMEVDYVRVYEDADTAPTVALQTPRNQAVFDSGDNVQLAAEAESPADNVASVTFLQDEGILAEVASPPFEYVVGNASAGCYDISARVEDDQGRTASSSVASVTVGDGCAKSPYLIVQNTIPGKIEVEHYDLGGSGVAFNDVDAANNGGAFRAAESVDIEQSTDAGRGFNIGWIEPGEWLSYTVNVESAGDYSVEARVASEVTGGKFNIEMDGTKKGSSLSFGPTGGWQTWTTVTLDSVRLDAGIQNMKIRMEGRTFNLNWVKFVKLGTNTASREEALPNTIVTFDRFPNPSIGPLTVEFTLQESDHVRIMLSDVLGRHVATLIDKTKSRGSHRLEFDLGALPGGSYLLHMTGSVALTRQIILIR